MDSKKVLLVEDSPDDQLMTKRALKKAGVINELVVVDDGEKALHYLFGKGEYQGRDVSEVPAVVLLDLNLPKISGLEVLEAMRRDKRTKYVPVVILTSSKNEDDVIKGYDIGCNSYIRKPVDFNQFHEAVCTVGLYWLVLNETSPK